MAGHKYHNISSNPACIPYSPKCFNYRNLNSYDVSNEYWLIPSPSSGLIRGDTQS